MLYLFGRCSFGGFVVSRIYDLQCRGKYLWLRHIGLVGEISGFAWMFGLNITLYIVILLAIIFILG